MKPFENGVSLLPSPWTDTFLSLLEQVENDLLISSPYVKRFATEKISETLLKKCAAIHPAVKLVTDMRPESALAGSMDLDAISALSQKLEGFKLVHLPSVHAKVYIADCKIAVITSGNLTEPGMRGNVEYGVALTNQNVVNAVRCDVEAFAAIGTSINPSDLPALAAEMTELTKLFRQYQNSTRVKARRIFNERLEHAKLKLMKQRVIGKTLNSVFSDSIRFLLQRGPIATKDLHPLVKDLNPDFCDDSVDRVIDGVHFGKKWKHHVRIAQQSLKKRGEIRFDGKVWSLSTHA